MPSGVAFRCVRCGAGSPADDAALACEACAGPVRANLEVVYAEAVDPRPRAGARGLWRWAGALPVDAADAVTLGEGATPLIDLPALGSELGVGRLLAKCEHQNPTWSFKDRLGAVAVAWARARGIPGIAVSSSGNAGATAAAYAARAGLPCIAFGSPAFPGPMQRFMRSYGAMVVNAPTAPERWVLNRLVAERWGWLALSNTWGPPVGSHPIAIEGAKTIAYEIAEDLGGRAPGAVVLPVAYGDALCGVYRGFRDLLEAGLVERMPVLVAAEAAPTLSAALASGAEAPGTAEVRATRAASVATPQGSVQALRALRAAGGRAVAVSDDEALAAHRALREREGILAELSGAMPLAAARALARDGVLGAQDEVVLVVTSGGLKDLDVMPDEREPPLVQDVSMDGLERALEDAYAFAG